MWRLFLVFILLTPSAWATQWRAGTGEQTLAGDSNASLIGYNSYNSVVKPLDNLLATYCNEYLTYASSTTLTVSKGSCAVSNSQGSIRLFLQDTANTTLTWSNIDTGSQQASTTYYVYSTAASNSATASTYYISVSNTAPSGQTYYFQIGSFTTDSSTNITAIANNGVQSGYVGTATSKSAGVVYQALTDGTVYAIAGGFSGNGSTKELVLYSDSSSSPSTQISHCGTSSTTTSLICTASGLIRKGDYYKVTDSTGALSTLNFQPIGK